ncbi:hypothetical protein OG456_47105 [Streptomyces sp. NBC_01446]|uniref:Uncharacterized protein n=1 Tax=Streptomyces sp. NBC_00119 TaxID=2975659 RepID=A0AAU1UPH0_9ACTN|nr:MULTISPECIES: hypothetical protein [unclassified Streptomyces]MCX4649700.1 hypothetical protein [Streptomyces sp. NBC_01446]MCX5321091.1 hypothetical protein [Streptomyces sp. NBC_00120]
MPSFLPGGSMPGMAKVTTRRPCSPPPNTWGAAQRTSAWPGCCTTDHSPQTLLIQGTVSTGHVEAHLAVGTITLGCIRVAQRAQGVRAAWEEAVKL